MKLYLNQIEITVTDGIPLIGVLEEQSIKPEGIAVAINNRIISRDSWSTTAVEEGAKLTIIQATYGG